MYNFDKLLNRKDTDCVKWDELESVFGNSDLLPYWVADMDFEVLPELKEAIVKRAEHPTYGYTFPNEDYYNNFIKWNKERNDFHIEKDDIISVPGVVTATSFVIYAFTQKGDKVLLNTPIYNPFFDVIKAHNRELVTSKLILNGDRYEIDWEDFESKLKDGVKLFILCSPYNPVGRVWTREELERVVKLCKENNVLIFSDEIHSDLVFPGHKHIPTLSISKDAEKITISAMAPSKTFNIAGLKSSMIIVKDARLREELSEAIEAFHLGVGLFGYKATEVAYGYGGKWADELVEYLYENAKFVVDFFEKNMPKVKAYVPDGTYLMWIDFSAYDLTQEELIEKLKGKARVALNNGQNYGEEDGNGFMRLNIGTTRELLQIGLNRIKEAFEE
ncbi:MAG: pyridoxal phosphate-dependent aminotransferase [Clostridium sp.]|uniref:MalY/PatB family protein n=1 Tax=Clostridium sp. TaxID=1506 RepID=UPI002A8D0C04|nr:pyridoxal phosphate-dependent aminotransferase [Clostridium sp.]MDY5098029.1 MalY/PatB family protein [Clostridium sp.]